MIDALRPFELASVDVGAVRDALVKAPVRGDPAAKLDPCWPRRWHAMAHGEWGPKSAGVRPICLRSHTQRDGPTGVERRL